MSARVFLTGATGFIGSQVTRVLVDKGYEVYALVRKGADTTRIAGLLPQLHVIEGSIDNPASFERKVAACEPEVCIHLAWYAEPGLYLRSPLNLDHLRATLDLVLMLPQMGCRRFIGAGTCLEYATVGGKLSESARIAPQTLYAVSKYAAFMMARDFAAANDLQLTWLRFFYQHGPYEHPERLVPSVVRSLLLGKRAAVSSGEQERDFLHIYDVAAAVAAITGSGISGPVNIGSGTAVRVREIVEAIGTLTNRPELIDYGALPQRGGDPEYIVADNSRLLSTGWKPQFDMRDGLANSIDWWRNQMRSQNVSLSLLQ